MKKFTFAIIISSIVTATCLIFLTLLLVDGNNEQPHLNHDKKWRIAYYEGGHYPSYGDVLLSMMDKFTESGWMEKIDRRSFSDPLNRGETDDIWTIAGKLDNKYLEFKSEHYLTSGWSPIIRKDNKEKIIYLCKNKEIDLILALGTQAGQDVVGNCTDVPVVLLSVTDPVTAGIFKTYKDTDYDNVFSIFDPNFLEAGIIFYQKTFGISKLGALLGTGPSGRALTGGDKLPSISRDLKFDIEWCELNSATPDEEAVEKKILECVDELIAKKIDTLFIASILSINKPLVKKISAIAIENKIPTIAMNTGYVAHGLLIGYGMQNGGYVAAGELAAEAIIKIFNNTTPRKIKNPYERIKAGLSINLDTATAMGFKIPKGLQDTAIALYRDTP